MSGSQILVLALNIVPWAVVGWFLSRSDDIRAEKAAKKRAVPVRIDMSPAAARDLAARLTAAADELEAQ